jgi:hypothetical protein
VIDLPRQLVEEPFRPVEVRGIECCNCRRRLVQVSVVVALQSLHVEPHLPVSHRQRHRGLTGVPVADPGFDRSYFARDLAA